MKNLTKAEFCRAKRHDNLAILGSGFSINLISRESWGIIDEFYDTLGMNWFCKLGRPTTWYIVREQCTTPRRCVKGQELTDFLLALNRLSTTLIVKDMAYRTDNYQHARNTHKFLNPGRVFAEIPGKCSAAEFCDDIFSKGIHHGKGAMWDALHFAFGMGYREILFVGVDLYDSRYFWLPYDQPSDIVLAEGRQCHDEHLTAHNTIRLVQEFIVAWKIPCFVQNPKSMLAKIIPVWGGA